MRPFVSFGTLVLLLAAAQAPARAEAPPGNVEIGLRSGYSLALGDASGPDPMSNLMSGVVPIWLDLGYRGPHFYAGVFLQYGIGVVPQNASFCPGVTCDAYDVATGLELQGHLMPSGKLDPWLGLGAGYEWLDFTFSENSTQDAPNDHLSIRGWQFVHATAGLDFRDDEVMPGMAFGPFVMVTVGQFTDASGSSSTASTAFTIPQEALHEWLTFGVRGAYDIGFAPKPSSSTAEPAPE